MRRLIVKGVKSISDLEWELWQTLVAAPVAWSVLGRVGRRAGRSLVRCGLVRVEQGWLRKVDFRVSWLMSAQTRLIDSASRSPAVDELTISRVAGFIASLSDWVAEPFIAVGDAGVIDIEWESSAGGLTVSFSPSGDCVCWLGSDGDEWEQSLAASSSELTGKLAVVSYL